MARLLLLAAACVLMVAMVNAQVPAVTWCSGQLFDRSITASLNQESVIVLCVQMSINTTTTNFGVEVREVYDEVADVYPTGILFAYPYDEINFPAVADTRWEKTPGANYALETSGATTVADPYTNNWYFKPSVGSECAYTVCYEGYHNGTNQVTEKKVCTKIEVINLVLSFDGADLAEGVLSGRTESISTLIKPQDGFFMSTWVYPSCDAPADVNMTIMSFESDRGEGAAPDQFGRIDEGLKIRNSINYQPSTGSFFYFDCFMGEAMSKPEYCCNKWHFVGVSVQEDGTGHLFVDGIAPKLMSEKERDVIKYSVVEFNTESRPDNTGNAGKLRIAANFTGYLDDMGVWDRSMTAEEFEKFHYMRDYTSSEAVAFWDMTTDQPGVGGGGETKQVAIPSIIPCVLGMEHNVGPVDGACVTEVYGWNFADAVNPKCNFGGVEMKAAMISYDTLKCETPGHVSPRFVDVTASNDGFAFTNIEQSGKPVKHLFLESSLYLTGEGNGGAEADSVCNDLPTKAVSFGAWVCPKCGPPVPPPPPSP
eukprot:CAMPEP_0198206892 /NCGR_PEP_ID=MMETSP1445-20131203/10406_1 /TAXON_ID=36898 /ORGANISM="Pyramimonas sp., Strain CCMP2087" /LENGTH=537 /DNA_ID=CAMNT_0043879751 /DNA_START=168 /DNA_END=1778 /DNA_ORIENTATION=+